MKTFNPTEWVPIATGSPFELEQEALHLRSENPMVVFVEYRGVQAIAATGLDCNVRVPRDAIVTIKAKGMVFLETRHVPVYQPQGEVFTNVDRLPHESGSLDAVRSELRRFKLEQRSELMRLRAAAADLRALREQDNGEKPKEAVKEPESVPEPSEENEKTEAEE